MAFHGKQIQIQRDGLSFAYFTTTTKKKPMNLTKRLGEPNGNNATVVVD